MTLLQTNQITQRRELQMRPFINQSVVDEYCRQMADGEIFPPVTVIYDGECYLLVDGYHRLEATLRWGKREIEAQIIEGTMRDAILWAAGANANHGLRRDYDAIRASIKALLRDEEWRKWSNREIAKRVGCDHKTVGKTREQMEATGEIPSETVRQTADGRVMQTAAIAAANEQRNKYDKELAKLNQRWRYRDIAMEWLAKNAGKSLLQLVRQTGTDYKEMRLAVEELSKLGKVIIDKRTNGLTRYSLPSAPGKMDEAESEAALRAIIGDDEPDESEQPPARINPYAQPVQSAPAPANHFPSTRNNGRLHTAAMEELQRQGGQTAERIAYKTGTQHGEMAVALAALMDAGCVVMDGGGRYWLPEQRPSATATETKPTYAPPMPLKKERHVVDRFKNVVNYADGWRCDADLVGDDIEAVISWLTALKAKATA